MVEIAFDDLRQIQLNMLKDLHRFCSENKINYSLAYGSLLGAVRHQGFIPWDDDVDVMMTRTDYNRFIKEYRHEYFKVISIYNTEGYCFPFAKLADNRTIVIENMEMAIDYGVFIDIFPVDNVPNSPISFAILQTKKKMLNYLHVLKNVSVSSSRNTFKNFILYLSHFLLSPISNKRIVFMMNSLCISYYQNSTNRVAILAPTDNNNSEVWPAELFNNYVKMPFEGIECCCVEKWNKVLVSMYGDYMKLPPPEKRKTHHSFTAFWKERY